MLMEEFHFFETGVHTMPDLLESKSITDNYVLGVITALTFLFLAIAIKNNEKIVRGLPRVFMFSVQTEMKLKEIMRLGSLSSLLLTFNFLALFGVCTYLLLSSLTTLDIYVAITLSVLIPSLLLILQVMPAYFVRFISGESLPMISLTGNTLTGYQIGSVFLGIISTVWILNPHYQNYAITSFLLVFIILQVARLIKNTHLLLSSGISWYYLMLYLCSLEILPLFVAYYYVYLNFMS
jgi:hypothetical protein